MTIANRYNLIKQLGEGGFGEVWLAEDTMTSTQVALKLYKVNSRGHNELVREYRLVSGLKHPNLLTASYVGRDDEQGISFLEMDYCRYGSLENKIGNLTEKQIWQCIRDVSAGLQALASHTVFNEKSGKEVAAPVVHQDIKPANILIRSRKENGEMTFAIADFGISKMNISQKSGSTLYSSAGTLSYMAPERFKSGYHPIVESDIWSVGAMLYELVEGKLPFASIEGLAGGNWLNQKGVVIPEISNINVSQTLKYVINGCMSKDLSQRPTAELLLTTAIKSLEYIPKHISDSTKELILPDKSDTQNHSTKSFFYSFIQSVLVGIEIASVIVFFNLLPDAIWSMALISEKDWSFISAYGKGFVPGAIICLVVGVFNVPILFGRKTKLYGLIIYFLLLVASFPTLFNEFEEFVVFAGISTGASLLYCFLTIVRDKLKNNYHLNENDE